MEGCQFTAPPLLPHKLLFISQEEIKHKTHKWKHISAQIKHNLLTLVLTKNLKKRCSDTYLNRSMTSTFRCIIIFPFYNIFYSTCFKKNSSYSWFCENSCVRPSKIRKEKGEGKYKIINWHHPHFPRPYISHFLSQNTIHLQLNTVPFFRSIFYGGFKLLWNAFKDHLSFLDHYGIYFKVLPV